MRPPVYRPLQPVSQIELEDAFDGRGVVLAASAAALVLPV